MKKVFILFFLQFLLISTYAQLSTLRNQILSITKDKKAIVGVSVLDLNKGDTLTMNNKHRFPMQSVFKFHLGMTVLHLIDKGKFKLDQPVFIKKSDLSPDLYSPIRDKYPDGNVTLPLSEIIRYTVSQSDNSGCDLLFKMIGGTEVANQYIHSLGIKEVAIKNPEVEIQADWSVQYKNWTSPTAATKLLEAFYKRNILSKKSYDFLWKAMVETSTGPNKIKGKLPKEAIVAHKTGFSGKNKEGMTGATNDIGIIITPTGKKFAIALFVSDSMESETINDSIIADITKVVWDYYSNQ
jgi:beta-lactamase class A